MPDRNISLELRCAVLERDNYTCQYCGRTGDDVRLEIGHIIPVSRGGVSGIRNLVTACEACNREKQDRLISREALQELAKRINSSAEYLAELLNDKDIAVLNKGGEDRRSEKLNIYLTPRVYADMKALAHSVGQDISDIFFSLAEDFVARNRERLSAYRDFLAQAKPLK